MNLSPEAQAELERQMQGKIRLRKQRDKLARFFRLFGMPIGIVAGIVAYNNVGMRGDLAIFIIALMISTSSFALFLAGILNFLGIDPEI